MNGKAKILLVDDSQVSRLAVEAALADLEQEIVSVSSGEEALRELLEHDFAVVLLDIVMPGMSGFEAAKLIRGRPRSRGTPIIFMTGILIDERHQMEAYETGAVDFLVKPLNPVILRSKVQIFVDLFLERQRCQEFANREAALLELDQVKDDFLAVVSDELRTPLTVILGSCETIQDKLLGPLTPEQCQALSKSHAAAQKLLSLVENLLDMSRIIAGKLVFSVSPVSFGDLLQSALAEVAPQARERQLTIELEMAGELVLAKADPGRLRQVLTHLLSNAIKFSEPGSTVKVRARKEKERLWCEVQDFGIGIAESELAHLFKPLTPLDSSTTRATRGIGLGLCLSKNIIEAHGGLMGVKSQEGQGSTFFFELPLTPCSQEKGWRLSKYRVEARPPEASE